jgi:hypothetical protein
VDSEPDLPFGLAHDLDTDGGGSSDAIPDVAAVMKASCTKGQRQRDMRITGGAPSRSWMLAGWVLSVRPRPSVYRPSGVAFGSTMAWRLRPLIFLPAS